MSFGIFSPHLLILSKLQLKKFISEFYLEWTVVNFFLFLHSLSEYSEPNVRLKLWYIAAEMLAKKLSQHGVHIGTLVSWWEHRIINKYGHAFGFKLSLSTTAVTDTSSNRHLMNSFSISMTLPTVYFFLLSSFYFLQYFLLLFTLVHLRPVNIPWLSLPVTPSPSGLHTYTCKSHIQHYLLHIHIYTTPVTLLRRVVDLKYFPKHKPAASEGKAYKNDNISEKGCWQCSVSQFNKNSIIFFKKKQKKNINRHSNAADRKK